MAGQKQLRIVLINAENLFLFMDKYSGQDLSTMTEREWQGLSYSPVPNKTLYKVKWLADSLLDIDADIILFNEVGGLESLNNFNRHFLKSGYQSLLIEGNSDRGIDVGYLVRSSLPFRYLLNSHKRRPLELNTTLDMRPHFFSRDVAELRIFSEKSLQPLMVIFLTHLKSKWDRTGTDPEGRTRRQAEVHKLVDIYNEAKKELGPQVRFVVAGDFNGSARGPKPESEFTKLHRDSDLKDIFDILKIDEAQTATQIQFRRSQGATPLHIDHIFINPALAQELEPSSCYVYRFKSDLRVTLGLPTTIEQRNALPSDHYPVVATFNLLGDF